MTLKGFWKSDFQFITVWPYNWVVQKVVGQCSPSTVCTVPEQCNHLFSKRMVLFNFKVQEDKNI